MATKQKVDLAIFDGQLIDGLDFCHKVYDLFDQIRGSPNGLEHIRLRSTQPAKKLIEELIPIARYVQARYREGCRINVKWFGGSQTYDAILWCRGDGVKHGGTPRKLVVEVTSAAHKDDYLRREQLHKEGISFGPKKIGELDR